MTHNSYMQLAIDEAKKAFDEGEIPIGAILVKGNEILGKAHNTRESTKNPLHHAEIHLLEQASTILNDWRLIDTILYVTVEPCPMCLGALLQARVGKLVYGCSDPKRLFQNDQNDPFTFQFPSLKNIHFIKGNNHQIEIVGGVLENECAQLLKDFFERIRN